MARPSMDLDDEQVKQLETLASVLTMPQLADYFGMSEKTLKRIRDERPEVNAAYKRGKATVIAKVAGKLVQQALSGNTTSMIFFLKTQAGWKETERREHAGEMPQIVISPEPIKEVA